jgi:hypothetical protein
MAPPARKRIAFAHFRLERVDQVNVERLGTVRNDARMMRCGPNIVNEMEFRMWHARK